MFVSHPAGNLLAIKNVSQNNVKENDPCLVQKHTKSFHNIWENAFG